MIGYLLGIGAALLLTRKKQNNVSGIGRIEVPFYYKDFGENQVRIYQALHEQFPDTILLFDEGDYYEAYIDDAAKIAKTCPPGDRLIAGLNTPSGENYIRVLIERNKLDKILHALIQRGYKVAIADSLYSPGSERYLLD